MNCIRIENGIVHDFRTTEEVKKARIGLCKMLCTDSLIAAGLDAATQQNAALGIYSPERCDAIKSYI